VQTSDQQQRAGSESGGGNPLQKLDDLAPNYSKTLDVHRVAPNIRDSLSRCQAQAAQDARPARIPVPLQSRAQRAQPAQQGATKGKWCTNNTTAPRLFTEQLCSTNKASAGRRKASATMCYYSTLAEGDRASLYYHAYGVFICNNSSRDQRQHLTCSSQRYDVRMSVSGPGRLRKGLR
jgi:hypothetical protein